VKLETFRKLQRGDRITVSIREAEGINPVISREGTVTGSPFEGDTLIPVVFDVQPLGHGAYSVYFRDVVRKLKTL